MRDLIQMLVMGTAMALLALFVVWPYRVDGNSMEPNYHNGDLLLINKLSYRFRDPQPDEVIVFAAPTGQDLIKRVIRQVEPLKYWVEGDNKQASSDSRQFGPVAKKAIVGRVWWRVLTGKQI